MSTKHSHEAGTGRSRVGRPPVLRNRAAGGASDATVQGRCSHRWVTITTASASGGFEFRRCTQCGINSWLGPDGPVALDHVLSVLSRARPRGLWRYGVTATRS